MSFTAGLLQVLQSHTTCVTTSRPSSKRYGNERFKPCRRCSSNRMGSSRGCERVTLHETPQGALVDLKSLKRREPLVLVVPFDMCGLIYSRFKFGKSSEIGNTYYYPQRLWLVHLTDFVSSFGLPQGKGAPRVVDPGLLPSLMGRYTRPSAHSPALNPLSYLVSFYIAYCRGGKEESPAKTSARPYFLRRERGSVHIQFNATNKILLATHSR